MKRDNLLFLSTIGIISFFCIINIIISDNIMVGFSDSKFLYLGNEVTALNYEISGGVETSFTVKVYNKENISMAYKLGSVDASITNDNLNKKTCFSENETSIFGQYVSGDKSSKIIPAGGSGIWNLTIQFPNYYSGLFNGCITFYPSITGTTTINTLPRRGNFIDVRVRAVGKSFTFKSFASSRGTKGLNNSGVIKIYNKNKILQRTMDIGVNSNGTGEIFTDMPPGSYYIIFKGQSHLASYISGFLLSGNQILDFTTGTNLYGAQNYSSQEDDGYRYQTAGDLKNSQGNYDFMINGNDISIITSYGLFENGINILDPRNLNGDNAINVSDISIIGTNFEKTDPYYNNTFSR